MRPGALAGASAAGLAVLGALVGCYTGTAPPSARPSTTVAVAGSPRPLPADLAFDVEVAQARTDRVARVVELQVRNRGPRDVTVVRARLDAGTVAGESTQGRDVAAGRVRPVRVPLGPTTCDAPTGGPLRVELDVTTADGGAGTVVLTPTDEADDLPRIHGEDCAAQAVAAGLDLRLADDLAVRDEGGASVADVTLLVTPVPGGPQVRVVSVRATTLLRPAGAVGEWRVDVDSAAPPPDGRLVLATVPARCDLHAIAEDKRGTVLGVLTVVDGVEQPLVYVAAPPTLRGALYDYVLAACGVPTDVRPAG